MVFHVCCATSMGVTGAKVTAVEFLNNIGGMGIDMELAKTFHNILKKQGMNFMLGTKVTAAEKTGGQIKVCFESHPWLNLSTSY